MDMQWLKVRQVAARLSVSEKTVYNWLKSGQLVGHKIGKSWVISDEVLDRLIHHPPPTVAKVPSEAGKSLSIVEVAQRFAAITNGAAENGIVDILPPRRKSLLASEAMNEALKTATGGIAIAGIGLPSFFSDQGHHIFTLRRLQKEDRAVHIRALLLHPSSDFAKSRVRLEDAEHSGSLPLSGFYASSVRSMHLITSMQQAMRQNKNFKLETQFAHYWPSAHILLTDKLCFVELYHFGLMQDASGGHAEGNVPVFVTETGSDLYEAMKLHFEYIWAGNDPHIQVASLEETARDIQPPEV